jgi:glycosyltransferase involved in cell wall biosynthesis
LELVTIITANYNGSQYLAKAINSVLNQSYPFIEHVIVDDGSTDDSARLIKSFGDKDSRIKPILLPQNRGVARARNVGIENSTGKYIAFLDADDMWVPEKVEKQVAVFRQHPNAGLVVTDALSIDENDQILKNKKNRKKTREGVVSLYDYIAGKCHLSINAMTRRECLEKTGLFNPNYVIGEDYELWMRITREYEYYYLKEPLHLYRFHRNNATRNKLFNRESKIKILEEMVDNNPHLMDDLGRGFKLIMQRKYNSLGKAYYFADRLEDADVCFRKALELKGNLIQRLKAKLWRMVLKTKQPETAV